MSVLRNIGRGGLILPLLAFTAQAQSGGPYGYGVGRPDITELRETEYPGAIAEFYYYNHEDRFSNGFNGTLSLETERGLIEVHVNIEVTGGAERATVSVLTAGWFAYPDFQEVEDGQDFTFYIVEALS